MFFGIPTCSKIIGGTRIQRYSTFKPVKPSDECGWTGVPLVTNRRASVGDVCANIPCHNALTQTDRLARQSINIPKLIMPNTPYPK